MRVIIWSALAALLGTAGVAYWQRDRVSAWFAPRSSVIVAVAQRPVLATAPQQQDLRQRLAAAAFAQVGVTSSYDPAYIRLAYPGGDVPMDRGVCSDVVVRAFRQVGWDLQRCLHEDMAANFTAYPTRWGLKRPDANIDHRRVLNLMTWFDRQGWSVPVTESRADYLAGDIVAWDLGRGLTHIGAVVPDGQGRPLIVHNIGQGAQHEDVLFAWTQIGHYRIQAAFR
jgi:uncharacterized protein YijF (DUF1287 family)